MKAVIMAAGEGSRMRSTFDAPAPSKLLLPILGIPIIERVILAAKKAGIREFIIVTGYRGDAIREHLKDGSHLGVNIRYAENLQWKKGNAYSLFAARPLINPGERFFLLMGDHIFDPSLLSAFSEHITDKIKKAPESEAEQIYFLAVDSQPREELDVDEATKVFSADERITELGKKLDNFTGIDSGMFNFHHSIFDILEKEIEKGDGSLSSALQPVIGNGNLQAFFFQNYLWQDIDNKNDLEQAKRLLLKSLSKEKDGAISRYFNRRLSIPISAWISRFSITPNGISVISFCIALFSAFLFYFRHPLLGGLLAQLASVIDGVDGEIARLKFQESRFGAYFDSILDRYADAALIGGITAGCLLSETASPTAVFIAGFLALTASPFSMLAKEKFANLAGKDYIPHEQEGLFSYLPVNRDGRLAIIMIGGILNQLFAILILLAVLSNLQVIIRLIIARKYFQADADNIN